MAEFEAHASTEAKDNAAISPSSGKTDRHDSTDTQLSGGAQGSSQLSTDNNSGDSTDLNAQGSTQNSASLSASTDN
jgi:hypothetical protein